MIYQDSLSLKELIRISEASYPKKAKLHLSSQEKKRIIAEHMKAILETLELDLDDQSLQKTPERVAKMYVDEVFSGLNEETFPKLSFTTISEESEHSKNIVFLQLDFHSFCEHHLVPFTGKAYVAYIPRKKIIGLSKIPRIVKYYAKRPQIQERLTIQISDCLQSTLETEDVAVTLTAKHYCMIARGIEDQSSETTTQTLSGKFKSDHLRREEFFQLVRSAKK